jgi:hypothetical protein
VKDQRHIVGTSLDATYKAFDDFVDAVNSCLELDIQMPQSPEEWETINRQFRSKSTNEIIGGCVGALDGFFQRTTTFTNGSCQRTVLLFGTLRVVWTKLSGMCKS